MKNSFPCLAAVLLCLCGCYTTHTVERASTPVWGPEAVDRYAGKEVEVFLRDGRVCEGEILRLDMQHIVQRDRTRGADTSIAMEEVLRIDGGSNTGWTVLGLVGGALTGGLVGTALGMNDPIVPEDPTGITAIPSVANGAMTGALIGGIAGGLIVSLATRTHDYTIVHSLKVPNQPGSNNVGPGSSEARGR